VFSALLDQLADEIAQRTVARIEQLLAERQPEPDAYKLEQAAKQLGLSSRELRRRIAAGELPVRRVGRVTLISREAISQFLSRNGSSRDQ